MRRLLATIFMIILLLPSLKAQEIIDRVIAVAGNEPILLSEIELQLHQIQQLDPQKKKEIRCLLLDQMIQKKLLLSKAKTDSLKISTDQVENELNRRIDYFVSQLGSTEALEKYYEKSLVELKNDYRDAIREQLLIDQQQQKVIGNVDVSPEEIKKFYGEIPSDSLPYYNAEIEASQIVIYPKPTKAEEQRVIQVLRDLRSQILKGQKSFFTAAFVNSQDEGTRSNGGEMDLTRADNFVPEFSAAAMALHKDSISDVVKTKYGYHIIQLLDRKGDMIKVRHILIKPIVTKEVMTETIHKLDSLRSRVGKDSTSKFELLAYKYSQDEETRNRGGQIIDMRTNSSRIDFNQLDKGTFNLIDKLKVGEVSEPAVYKSYDGRDGYRILLLRSMTKPHKANLRDDYPKIKDLALQAKKARELEKWLLKESAKTYIRIDPAYSDCDAAMRWQAGKVGKK